MDQMAVFSAMYVNDLSLDIHEQLSRSCKEAGLSLKEATLRWNMHHSILGKDDGVILGASSTEQMEENINACEGGQLPEVVVAAFEQAWILFSGA